MSGRVLKDLFEGIDVDDSHSIDKREFQKAMQSRNVSLSFFDIDRIYRRYDANADGFLDYSEFIDLVGFRPKKISQDIDDLVFDIRSKLMLNIGAKAMTGELLKQAFEDIDMDDSHSIDKIEFRKAMKFLNVLIDPTDIDSIYRRYDVNDDGFLDYSEFIDLIGLNRK